MITGDNSTNLSEEDKEFLADHFFAFWDDEPEDDSEVIGKIISSSSPQFISRCLDLLHKFMKAPISEKSKSDFIRDSVYLYFSEESDEPINWLRSVLEKLEQASNSI